MDNLCPWFGMSRNVNEWKEPSVENNGQYLASNVR